VISGDGAEFGSGSVVSGAITFGSGGGTLRIDSTKMPTNVISGLAPGGVTIDLAGIAFVSGGTAQVVSGGTLQITEGVTSANLKLDPTENYTSDTFTLVSDGGTGTDVIVTDPPPASVSAAIGPQDILYRDSPTADMLLYSPNNNSAIQNSHHADEWSSALAALRIGDFTGDILFRENTTGGLSSSQLNGNSALNGLQGIGDASGILGEDFGKGVRDLLFRGDNAGAVGPGAISGDEKLHGSRDIGDPSTAYKVVR
jgi:hypothetical protein